MLQGSRRKVPDSQDGHQNLIEQDIYQEGGPVSEGPEITMRKAWQEVARVAFSSSEYSHSMQIKS